jgi:hypothetical protein
LSVTVTVAVAVANPKLKKWFLSLGPGRSGKDVGAVQNVVGKGFQLILVNEKQYGRHGFHGDLFFVALKS